MRGSSWSKLGLLAAITATGISGITGCASGSKILSMFTTPFPLPQGGQGTTTGPGNTGTVPGGSLGGGGRTNVDPCSETQARKFVSISMRNQSEDYIHYFLVMIAFVNGTTYPDGAVCPNDVDTYIANGYDIVIPEGTQMAFGGNCILGPALIYFHETGRFQGAGAGSLESAIAPADGSNPTYDSFFGATGRRLPVPNVIWFHNPGTGDGAHLLEADLPSQPCTAGIVETVDPVCQWDAFYYVDEFDNAVDTVRVANEVQGTGCRCYGTNAGWSVLAPSGANATTMLCDEFARGGSIEFVFLNEFVEPAPPQLVWRVRDSVGAVANDFDDRATIN